MTAAAIRKPALLNAMSTRERVSQIDQRAVLSFPPFRLDLIEDRLWKDGREVQLRPKPFAILRHLAQRPRRLVTRSEIVQAVWGSPVAMSGSLLRTHMSDLRHTLGEAVIETVIGRGYRFMATVNAGNDCSPGKRSEGADSIAGRTADWARGRHFELVRAAAPGSIDPIVARSIRSDAHTRALKQLADALAALGLSAAVVLVVGDAESACLQPATSTEPENSAPTPQS
jgi:DNA-binding winged helix-turn-helix (wHTH) protein